MPVGQVIAHLTTVTVSGQIRPATTPDGVVGLAVVGVTRVK